MRLFTLLTAVFLYTCLSAQTLPDAKQLKSIKTTELRKHISVLASDSLEGRLTTTNGQKKASQYIASQFKEAGLTPYNDTSYFQHFDVYTWQWGDAFIQFKNTKLSLNKDLIYFGSSPIDSTLIDCVFVGYGEDTIINNIDLKNKIAFAFCKDFKHYYQLGYKLKKKGALALILSVVGEKADNFEAELQKATSDNLHISKQEPFFTKTSKKIFVVKADVAEKMFDKSIKQLSAIDTPKKAQSIQSIQILAYCPTIINKVTTENVAGYIKGKSNETIVISAHYDHMGKQGKTIFYGADDNASGTSAVLTLAKAFGKQDLALDKSILFLATTGEELGLWGALEFASRQNELPFDIKANLNIDMIGRNDSIDKTNYVYLIGAQVYPMMDSLCHKANQLVNLDLDYGYDGKSSIGSLLNRSDHYAFHKQGIPVLGFFDGLHKDYHKPTDTVDKIEFNEMIKRVRLIYTMAYLATQKDTQLDQ